MEKNLILFMKLQIYIVYINNNENFEIKLK